MTDTLNKKLTPGQLFIQALEATKADKNKMFQLLSTALETTRANPNNKISDDETLVEFKARLAQYNAKIGCELNPEDYVYMTAKKYKDAKHGSIAEFKKDFQMFTQRKIMTRAMNTSFCQYAKNQRVSEAY